MDVKQLKAQLAGYPDDAEVRVDHEHGYKDADVKYLTPENEDGEEFVSITVG